MNIHKIHNTHNKYYMYVHNMYLQVKEALLVLQQHNCLTIELPPEVDVEGESLCLHFYLSVNITTSNSKTETFTTPKLFQMYFCTQSGVKFPLWCSGWGAFTDKLKWKHNTRTHTHLPTHTHTQYRDMQSISVIIVL